MRWLNSVDRRLCRLSTIVCLMLTFFLVELIYGHIIHSLTLISDSYHMLSDVVAIVIAIISIQVVITRLVCSCKFFSCTALRRLNVVSRWLYRASLCYKKLHEPATFDTSCVAVNLCLNLQPNLYFDGQFLPGNLRRLTSHNFWDIGLCSLREQAIPFEYSWTV